MERPTFTREDDAVNAVGDDKPAASPVHSVSSKEAEALGEKNAVDIGAVQLPAYTYDEERSGDEGRIQLETAEDIVTKVIDLEDDPTLNPWTFRMFFLGMLILITVS